jgi:hypothetical protein
MLDRREYEAGVRSREMQTSLCAAHNLTVCSRMSLAMSAVSGEPEKDDQAYGVPHLHFVIKGWQFELQTSQGPSEGT